MTHAAAHPDRLHELLAARATELLPPDETSELAALLATHPEFDEMQYDWAAAACDLPAVLADFEPAPAQVRSSLETTAVAWLARRKGLVIDHTASRPSIQPSIQPTIQEVAPPIAGMHVWPWLLAAACLVFAVASWWPSPRVDADPRAGYASLLVEAGTTRVAWSNPIDGLDVQGDVVWNNARQTGYMRLAGLAANDPTDHQYQLWIFDNARAAYGDAIAVDGGVFDVTETGEVIVPISAKLQVFEPTLFAVTTEPPGGVVKHNPELDPERYRIVLTAPVG